MDAYKVSILGSRNKVKACAKVGFKLVNSDMDYKWALVDLILNLVAFLNLKPTRFFFKLMQNEYGKETKLKVVGQLPKSIFDSLNKLLNILMNKSHNSLPPYKEFDHKMKVVLESTPPSKAPYRLNSKELQNFKT